MAQSQDLTAEAWAGWNTAAHLGSAPVNSVNPHFFSSPAHIAWAYGAFLQSHIPNSQPPADVRMSRGYVIHGNGRKWRWDQGRQPVPFFETVPA